MFIQINARSILSLKNKIFLMVVIEEWLLYVSTVYLKLILSLWVELVQISFDTGSRIHAVSINQVINSLNLLVMLSGAGAT